MVKKVRGGMICLILGFMVAQDGFAAPSGRDLWKAVIQKCTASDLIGRTLYFGPSNTVGPGALWRKTGRGYALRATLDMFEPDATARTRMVWVDEFVTCSGESTTKLEISGKAALESKVQPIEAEMGADLSRAKGVSLTIAGWRWEQIIEVPFEAMLLSRTGLLAEDLRQKNRLIEARALKVRGLIAELEFESNVGASLRAKYDGKTITVGGVEGRVTFATDSTMRITSADEFYVAGEMRRWKAGALAGAYSQLGDVEVLDGVPPVALELVK